MKQNHNITPGISFIVPTFNEEEYLAQCLSSIKAQIAKSTIPAELIVVDNNSHDNTLNIAKQFTDKVFVNSVKGSPSITRNIGARESQYSILCFVDGDCILADNWISRLLAAFTNKEVGAYGGPILSPANGNWVEKAWAPTESPRFVKTNGILAGANFSIRRNVFESLAGFNEDLISAEDDDLSRRVIQQGFTICYDSDQSVIHLGYPKSLLGILKKQIWHGSSQLRAHGLWGDRVVTLTLFFLIAGVYLVFSLILWHPWSAAIAGMLLLAIPSLLVYGRSKKFLIKNLMLYIKMYFICCAFMLGRTIGLIQEFRKKLFNPS